MTIRCTRTAADSINRPECLTDNDNCNGISGIRELISCLTHQAKATHVFHIRIWRNIPVPNVSPIPVRDFSLRSFRGGAPYLLLLRRREDSLLIFLGEGYGGWRYDLPDLLHHRYPVQPLAINTRAGAIGGFTPLSHGTPIFYTSAGDESSALTPSLRRFLFR